MRNKLISVIIPMYNEEEVILYCYKSLVETVSTLDDDFEFIFVDDGSRDKSSAIIEALQIKDSRIILLTLTRNFGKEAAVTAGLDQCKGDAVIIIDADLQDPPSLFPKMIVAWKSGADIVCMRRRSRNGETAFKKASAHIFYRFLNYLSEVDIPEDVGDFRLMSKRVVESIIRLPERSRYMKGIFAWVGYDPVFIDYERQAREAGTTKWNYAGLFKLAFEGITSFSVAPLRWMVVIGLLTAAGGFLYGSWIISKTLIFGEAVTGYPSIITFLTFIGGVQLLATGMLGEYIGKIYMESKNRPLYLIKDKLISTEVTKLRQKEKTRV